MPSDEAMRGTRCFAGVPLLLFSVLLRRQPQVNSHYHRVTFFVGHGDSLGPLA